jgi:hypothetical protein
MIGDYKRKINDISTTETMQNLRYQIVQKYKLL